MSDLQKKSASRISDVIAVHRETIMRETLCVKMVDDINDGKEWFTTVVNIGGEQITLSLRKATSDECC